MKLGTASSNQMAWMTGLLLAAGSSVLGLISIALTTLVLISSTFLLACPKERRSEQTQQDSEDSFSRPDNERSEVQKEDERGGGGGGGDCNGQADDSMGSRSSPDSTSESECINPSWTGEDSEADWLPERSPDCSDEEEGLIEIAVPSGHHVVGGYRHSEDDGCMMMAVGEMNEEDNLIEIDISEGSIKHPRFRL
ncbi:hypothetical protein SAY86_016693 [Trapa natans]|uniref:Uncharacterized protein n=1 Tax=Trapa natans TaxID=22666 RepID=A0AAN7LAT5_TRANT|nr:hypothetical protein SAY86_016693 [Trapa natans]